MLTLSLLFAIIHSELSLFCASHQPDLDMRRSTIDRISRTLLSRITVVTFILIALLSIGLLSCDNTTSELSVEIVGRWEYSFPPGLDDVPNFQYDLECGLIDAYPVTMAEIDGKEYLILGIPPLSSPYSSCFFIFDTENPLSPRLISTVTPKTQSRNGVMANSCAISQGILYSCLFLDKGLWMVDISDPANPVDLGIAPIEVTSNIIISGDYAYASGQMYDGVTIMDVSDTHDVSEIIRIGLPSRDCFLEVDDGYLYVGIRQTLTIFDVSDPASPEKLCAYELDVPEGLVREMPFAGPDSEIEGHPWDNLASIIDLQSCGDYLYVTFGAGQLRVIDISDPAVPKEVADVELGGFVIAMTLEDDNLYVTKSGNEASTLQLCLLDISRPDSPKLIDSVDTESIFGFGGASLAYMWTCPLVIGDYIYIAGHYYMDIVEIK